MEISQIRKLIQQGKFPVKCQQAELIETHISWVILCDDVVFKIKKPIRYDFLDFSTLQKRKFYCNQELVLNRRLAEEIYLEVVAIQEKNGDLEIALNTEGKVIDYAVMMKRMEGERRMDKLLKHGKVTLEHIEELAVMIHNFHQRTATIDGVSPSVIQQNFNDIGKESNFISEKIDPAYGRMVEQAITHSNAFIFSHENNFKSRSALGFVKDCHGDLHSRNIFLLKLPVIFDCIEFNPAIRQIDILNELAFLCMDLEAFGHNDLSDYFMSCYTKLSPAVGTKEDEFLFIYYKAYRANVRAKVNALRAKGVKGEERNKYLAECKKYLHLMDTYMKQIS